MAAGEEAAFREIFYEHNARLFPFIKKITQHEENAREIVQEVFLRLWIHRDTVAQLEQPAAWLYKIASNLSLSHLRSLAAEERRLQVVEQSMSAAAQNDTLEWLNAKETSSLIEEAVALLPEKRRAIYLLSRQEKLNHKEIAEQLGISSNTVKNQLVAAMKQIQEYLQKYTGCLIPLFIIELLF
jgi:RNA polymerase sigma-70 factor (ECF subfamily)